MLLVPKRGLEIRHGTDYTALVIPAALLLSIFAGCGWAQDQWQGDASKQATTLVQKARTRLTFADTPAMASTFGKSPEAVYAAIRDRVIPKILEDLPRILARKYADAISARDLYHVHVLIHPEEVRQGDDLDRMIADGAVSLLYHAHESDGKASSPDRNIVSSWSEAPAVSACAPDPDHGACSVTPVQLGGWSPIQIDFAVSEEELLRPYPINFKFDKIVSDGGYAFGISLDVPRR